LRERRQQGNHKEQLGGVIPSMSDGGAKCLETRSVDQDFRPWTEALAYDRLIVHARIKGRLTVDLSNAISVFSMRLLVVEDEVDLANAIARGLRRHGYAVDVATGAGAAEEKLRGNGYDLAILDWNLGDGSGLDLCRRMVEGDLPTLEVKRPRVLLLTARDDIEDRVAGLDAGADDYLVKPFAFAELAARTRALLRRDEVPSPVLSVGDLTLDPARFVAERNGAALPLTSKEFSLLEFLMRHAGEVMPQEKLLEHVWDEMADPFTNTVRVTVSNLRKKLGNPPVIETLPGRGYVLRTP
jgi:DNA-binding response OmpR family regulator